MTFRPAPLRAAAALAAVFIAARVMYRILFDGAAIGVPVLLDLPAFRLPAPYAHVVLLGPVTAPGLWAAVLSAVPIAGMFLAFGLLNAWVDVSRGFVYLARRGPAQGIARMLVVAWAALPSTLRRHHLRPTGVPAARRARRHAPARPRAGAHPRAGGRVAAALELRGLGGRPATATAPGPRGAPSVRSRRQRRHGARRRPSLRRGPSR